MIRYDIIKQKKHKKSQNLSLLQSLLVRIVLHNSVGDILYNMIRVLESRTKNAWAGWILVLGEGASYYHKATINNSRGFFHFVSHNI